MANQDLWKQLLGAVTGRQISWHHVRGHAGVPGNERVDQIAVAFSLSKRISLYSGSLLQYDVPIHDIPENTDLPPMPDLKDRKAPKATAYSYVSVVNGTAELHKTWAECEARVKGRSGAKFKKAMSAAEEAEILAGWGY